VAAQDLYAAGQAQKALAIANDLGQSIQTDPQAYAKAHSGELELERGKPAMPSLFDEAKKLATLGWADLIWDALCGTRSLCGRSSSGTCLKRRGEARRYSVRVPLTAIPASIII